MAKFTMTIEVDEHDHSARAHRHSIATALDSVKHAVLSGVDDEGEIVTPAVGATRRAVIGEWKITGGE